MSVEAVAVGLLDTALEWEDVGFHLFYHEGHEGNEGLKDETFQAVFQSFHNVHGVKTFWEDLPVLKLHWQCGEI